MHNILLLTTDGSAFELDAVERAFRSETAFRDIRLDEPGGAAIEADYTEPEDWSIVGLSNSRTRIALSGTSDAVLRAALLLQKHLTTPLRIVDTDYSFDLVLADYDNVEALRGAIERAQAS